jgi:hypothetical protein
MEQMGPTIRVRGLGATSRQRRLVMRAWQRWWAQYDGAGAGALVISDDVEMRVLSATEAA